MRTVFVSKYMGLVAIGANGKIGRRRKRAMSQIYQVTGELTDSRTLKLDEAIPLNSGKVRVVIAELEKEPKPDLAAFERLLRERQAARGHIPRTKEEIDAYLNAERDSWDFSA